MRFTVLLRRIGGTTIFMVGIVALVLPVLPGWFLIGLGLYILSLDSPGMQSRLDGLAARYPHVDRILSIVEKRLGVAGAREKRYTDRDDSKHMPNPPSDTI